MPKRCVICAHPDSIFIDADLAAGRPIPDILLKHFGHHRMLEALRRHKRSHAPHQEGMGGNWNRDEVLNSERWNEPMRGRPRHRKITYFSKPMEDRLVIATEPVRIKGVIYSAGTEIPETAWNPSYLAVALRLGTVRRKTP